MGAGYTLPFAARFKERDLAMFWDKKNAELEALFDSVNMNCRNNYKDAAQEDYQTYLRRLEELKESGKLNDKMYKKYKEMADSISQKMANYNHNNNVKTF